MTTTYFELRTADGGRERLDGVTSVGAAKAASRAVTKVTGQPVELYRVTEIDIDAPVRTRNTAS